MTIQEACREARDKKSMFIFSPSLKRTLCLRDNLTLNHFSVEDWRVGVCPKQSSKSKEISWNYYPWEIDPDTNKPYKF